MIVEASRPFRVVHANSAFMKSSGLQKVMGEPIDGIVTMKGDFLKHAVKQDSLDATLSTSTNCKLHMSPAMSTIRAGAMSHIVIKLDEVHSNTDNSKCTAINQLVGTIG